MRVGGLIATAALSFMMVGAAEAMPAAPLAPTDGPAVTLVRGGCGFGAHRGMYGGCRLNRGWRGRLRGATGGAPRGCPPGTHPTGRGFCRRNVY